MMLTVVYIVAAAFIVTGSEAAVAKRALGCKDGCQPYPSNTGSTGNAACIKAYGNMFKLMMNTWGDKCCPTGCGKAEGRREVPEKRALGCSDGCQPYPKNTGNTGNAACIKAYGDMFKLKMNTWGDQCCPSGCGKAEGRREVPEKRALGCSDGCQPYPKNTGNTGNAACIKAYGDMFKLKMNTWGDQCCPSGCGKAEGRREVPEKRALGCKDGCQPYPKNTGNTGNAACIKAYGNMFKLMMNTWGDKCCPTGCGKAEGRREVPENV